MTDQENQHSPNRPPAILPLFPLAGALLLPGGQLPLNIFEPRYLRMVDEALGGARMIGMIQPKDADGSRGDGPGGPSLYSVGCAGRITSFAETGDGRYLITLTGQRRFRLAGEIHADTPYRQGEADWGAFDIDAHEDPTGEDVDREDFLEAMRDYLTAEGLKTDWDAAASAPIDALVASLAMGCPFEPTEKQALLEARTTYDRAQTLMALMEISGAADPDGDQRLQ